MSSYHTISTRTLLRGLFLGAPSRRQGLAQLSNRSLSSIATTRRMNGARTNSIASRNAWLNGSILRRRYGTSYGGGPRASYSSAIRAVWTIIGLNAAVFGAWKYAESTRDSKLLRLLQQHATLSWDNMLAGRYWTIFTSAFSHTWTMHFAFNMIALHAFGSIMAISGVPAMHIFSLCFGCGLAGSTAWLYQRKEQGNKPRAPTVYGAQRPPGVVDSALGASGMVMGAAGVATCLMPFAPMNLMFIPIPIPLWVLTGLYATFDIYFMKKNDRIGHAAHLGGMAYGVLYYFLNLRRFGGVWQMARRIGRR